MDNFIGPAIAGIIVAALMAAYLAFRSIWANVSTHIIYEGMQAILYRDGQFVRELSPGRYRWYDPGGRKLILTFPREAFHFGNFALSPITKDQFSFRMTLGVVARITDSRMYFEKHQDKGILQYGLSHVACPQLAPNLSALVLEATAARTLDEFLAAPKADLPDIQAKLSALMRGMSFDDILITEITMPPEVRKMFTEVERARREGLAALERARGEVASLRALANAARSLQDNPNLAQLRVLHAMETAKGSKTFVLGNPPQPDITPQT